MVIYICVAWRQKCREKNKKYYCYMGWNDYFLLSYMYSGKKIENRIQRNILYYYDVFSIPGTHHCLHNKKNLQSCLATDAAR